ncbi:glycosyltransferase [Fundidesulfovibrio butyratiphilus]
MKPIKTILLLQDLHCGGTQRHALELAARLDPERFDVSVWTLMGGEGFLPRARELGVRVRQLARGNAVTPAGLWGLWNALRRERPEIVMALTVVPNIWGRVLGRLAGVPLVVANCRGADDLWRQHEGWLKNLAVHHICNAQALAQALTQRYGLPEERVSVIPTGVDVVHYAPPQRASDPAGAPSADAPVVLCLARLAPVKDHATLIAAFEIAWRACPAARLRVVGDGPLAADLAERMAASPAAEHMEVAPGVLDTRAEYAKSDVVALSSVSEGMPNTLLEAQAMGIAVAATDVGGVAEAVPHGVSGLLSPAGDPAALGANLARLLADADLRRRMGAAGRARVVARHSLEEVAGRHAKLLLTLAGRFGR